MSDDEGGRWLSYDELAKARGISRQSAVRTAFRRKWRRQVGNDGTTRVLVPLDGIPDIGPAVPHDMPDDTVTRLVVSLEAAVTALREQLERSNARADRAEQGRDAERARADELRDQIAVLRAELAADRTRADQADAALREAQERLDALARSAQTRLLRGRLARLLPWRRVEW